MILQYFLFFCRNNSIACLRAKAEQARLLNNGLLFQVRSLAGLQSPVSHSPQSCDSNANTLIVGGGGGGTNAINNGHHSPHTHHHSVDLHARSFHHVHQSPGAISGASSVKNENKYDSGINMTAF